MSCGCTEKLGGMPAPKCGICWLGDPWPYMLRFLSETGEFRIDTTFVLGCVDCGCGEIRFLPIPANRGLAGRPKSGWRPPDQPIYPQPGLPFLRVKLAKQRRGTLACVQRTVRSRCSAAHGHTTAGEALRATTICSLGFGEPLAKKVESADRRGMGTGTQGLSHHETTHLAARTMRSLSTSITNIVLLHLRLRCYYPTCVVSSS